MFLSYNDRRDFKKLRGIIIIYLIQTHLSYLNMRVKRENGIKAEV